MLKKQFSQFKINPDDSDKIHLSRHIFLYNYLLGMVMLYMMLMILSGVTVHKIIEIGPYIGPAAVLVTPFIYSISNILTEVYGFAVARNMMWWFIWSSFIFSFGGLLLTKLPSPIYFNEQHAYDTVLGQMPITFIAGILGTFIGMTVNSVIVSKTKVILCGKGYWFRSIISTVSGEVVYNLVAYPIMFYHKVSLDNFIYMLICVTAFKICTTAMIWPIEIAVAYFLKKQENVDVIDYGVSYNPFKFSISDRHEANRLRVINNPLHKQ
jgi:queuosine precursor transporter